MSDLLTAIAERRAAAASATWPDYTDTIEQPETMVLVWDVIAAAEKRRQADIASGLTNDPMSYDANLRAEDAALAALADHLRGNRDA